MDAAGLSVVTDLFQRVDADIDRESRAGPETARQLFHELGREGGGVETLGEPAIRSAPLADLGRWTDCPWDGPTYGLDASTTRPIEFTNGLVMDAAYARLGVAGEDADRSVEERGTVKTVVAIDGPGTIRPTETDDAAVDGELVRFPAIGGSNRLPRRVSTAAQGIAESEHLRACLDAIDGPTFVDGSIYPLGVVYWLLLDELGRDSPAATWDRPADILRDRMAVVDALHDRDLPLIGVVKTSTMDAVVGALHTKLDDHDVRHDGSRPAVPWTRDRLFVREALRGGDPDHATSTSWLVQTERTVDGRSYEPLDPAREFVERDPAAYRRAFCYVRLPPEGTVFRIEAPHLMVDDPDRREAVRLIALRELARTRDVPRAIRRADRLARITPANRERIRRTITTGEYAHDYNWDGRWADLEEAP